MLVNKPKKVAGGQVEYTMSQPLLNEVPLDDVKFEGSDLDTEYLEVVDPHPTPS